MGYVYWCAACGNPDIIIEKVKSGYSMGKGIVGAAVLGPVGAVAGLDGKEAESYYCPKCGARLDHSMPDYEVSDILNMIKNPEIYRTRLEEKHKRYPNMMLPQGWVSESSAPASPEQQSTGTVDLNTVRRIIETSTDDNVADRLFDYYRQFRYVDSLEILQSFRNNNPLKDKFRNAERELERKYRLRETDYLVNGIICSEIAKDDTEAREWRWESVANKSPVDGYIEFVKGLIGTNPITIQEIEQEIIKKEPNVNFDNPCMARSLAKRACRKIADKDGFVDFNGMTIQRKSSKIAENDLRWDIEETVNGYSSTKEGIGTILAVVDQLKSGSTKRYSAITRNLQHMYTSQKVAVALKKLQDHGCVTRISLGNDSTYTMTSAAIEKDTDYYRGLVIADRLVGLNRKKKEEIFERLKNNSGKTFWELTEGLIEKESERKNYYSCLMALELEGHARRLDAGSDYIWEFIDKNAALREALKAEKSRLEKEIEEYNASSSETVSKYNNLIKELQARTFDGSEYTTRIKELENEKYELLTKQSSLGFFKFAEKKQVQEDLGKCETKLFEIKGKLSDAEKSFNSDISELETMYKKEIKKCTDHLSSLKSKLNDLDDQLSKL